MKLFPFQETIIESAREAMRRDVRSMVIVSPTGSGKTVLTAFMLRESAKRGIGSIFTVHRRELLHQTVATLKEFGIKPGLIASGFPSNPERPVQIASIQTLVRRLDKVKKPGLLVCDEFHHAPAGQWSKTINHFKDAYTIGLTATPERLDGKGLGDYVEEMILGPTTAELIDQGYLSPYRAVIPPGINVEGVHKRAGDFKRDELAEIVGQPSVTGDAVREYTERASGRRAIAYCVSVELSRKLAEAFQEAGVSAEHVDAGTAHEERDAAMARFRSGETMILCNVDLFGEGVDVPEVEAGIFLRPTLSLSLYLQQVGRILRVSPGKEDAMLLDHAGNILRHGLPDDDRPWSLEGHAGAVAAAGARSSVRICPNCYAANRVSAKLTCSVCNQPFPIKPRIVATREGRLEEMSSEEIRRARSARKQEQGRARTHDELVALARKRRYKNPNGWAWMILRARQGRKMAGM